MLWHLDSHVVGGQARCAAGSQVGPVGVEPRMHLHASGMGALDQVLERVPERRGRLALGARQVAAPWLYARRV